MTEPESPRAIVLEQPVGATPEEVWAALSDGAGLARWFAPMASVTPGAGGTVTVAWEPGEEWTSDIEAWEPGRRLRIASDQPLASGRVARLTVDFHIETDRGSTVVRLVHAGFDGDTAWDDMVDGLEAGWTYFLLNLRHALERHPGQARVMVSAHPRWRMPVAETRAALYGPGGLAVTGAPAGFAAGDEVTLAVGGETLAARVLIANLPRTAAFLIPELNDALLFVEREGMDEVCRVGVWLSLYGVPAPRVARLREALGGWEQGVKIED
ncbi:MAG: SRPBCC domain-containing protein [Vicinamibacterales bacterium]